MIIRAVLVVLINTICLSLFSQVTVTTNKQTSRYGVGEQISFRITSNQSGNATYNINYDNDHTIQTGTIFLQAGATQTVTYTAYEPTLIRCSVNINGQGGEAAAVVGAYNIQPREGAPGDFDSFWANQKAQLASVPINPNLTPHSNTAYSTTYKINLGHVDNRRVYGYITIPNGNGYYPAVVTLPPYGSNTSITVPDPTFAEQSNTISMTISIHNNDPSQFATDAYNPDNFLYREQNYYRWGVLAGVRAIDYLYSRPDVDKNKIGLFGNSQGGGLSMLVAGIDNRVNALMLTISALCGHEGFKYGRASGFPYYLQEGSFQNYPQEQTLQAVKYYDAIYGAARFKGSVLMSISYLDNVTAPVTEFAAFNQFTGDHKILIHSTRLYHVSPSRMWEDRFKFLRRIWPNATANPLLPYGDNYSKGHWADAGTDIGGQTNSPINLNGFVRFNDNINYSWPVTWEKVSGPGNVNFSNPNNRSTSASFSTNGSYTLRFRAEDGQTYAGNNTFMTMEDYITVTIGQGGTTQQNQTITFANIPDKFTTDNPFQISATASSGLAVSYTIVSGPATISGTTITLTGQPGTVTVRANQWGNANYNAAEATQSFQAIQQDGGGGGNTNCSNPTLVSQSKPSSQSSTLSVNGTTGSASKAVDGNTNGNFWAGSVSATTNSYQPWLQVDLGSVHNITEIKVWNRTEGANRLNDYHVMISDNPFSSDLNAANNSASWNQYTNGQAGTPSNYTVNNSGRYIRIQANSNSYLTIAEVQVFGCNTGSSGGGGGGNCQDSDNDGTCDVDDCFIWNPSLPAAPGTPCDDYNPNNFNDVIQADGCTCQGTNSNSGGGGGNGCTDSDNDGTCDVDDCFIWNPTLPAAPGTPCDDYDPHNFNDVIQADGCTCQGTNSNSGGGGSCQDSDNDGTCDVDDCFILNPSLPAAPGTPCDDYDPHYFNDVIQADGCTCQGTNSNSGGGGGAGGSPGSYCESGAISTAYEYIEKVRIGEIDNLSGNNYGYSNFTWMLANVAPNSNVAINLIPGFSGSSHNVYWRIWIDFNQDGDFYDADEYIYQRKSNQAIYSSIQIPNNVPGGITRMRVSMKAGAYADPCEDFAYGEVEDYSLYIAANSAPRIGTDKLNSESFDFKVRPNPVDDFVITEFENKPLDKEINQVYIYNSVGERLSLEQMNYQLDESRFLLFTDEFKPGYYLISIQFEDQIVSKPFIKIR